MTAPIRFIAGTVEIQAAASPKGPKRFTTLAYTGGPMLIAGYDSPIVIDLAGLTARRGVKANLDHDATKRVGDVTAVENDGRQLTLAGVVSAASAAAAEFVESAALGYEWQASVEVAPQRLENVPAGATVEVNGQRFSGPLYVTRRGQLHGVAFVAAGADDQTNVSIAAKRSAQMMTGHSDFHDWAQSVVNGTADMTPDQMALMHANFQGRSEATDADRRAVAPFIAASHDAVEVETRRLRQIDAATRAEFGDHAAAVAELKAKAVAGEMTVDELLTQLRPIRSEIEMSKIPAAHTVRATSRQANGDVIHAALCLAGGLANPEQHFDERTLDAADKRRNVGVQSLLLEAAASNGMIVRPGMFISAGNLREVLGYAFPPIHAAGGFSTIDVSNVVAATANKFLREGWNQVDQTCLRIAAIRAAKDFKAMTTVSLTGGTTFEQVGADGELKHGTLGDLTYTNQVSTYGAMLAITRQDIINDDIGALSAVPRKIGRAGMLKLNKIFWTVFLGNDGGAFFHSSHSNVSTDTGALGLTGLQQAETKFINQTDPDGEPLGILPAILLVPPSLKSTALELMNSQLTIGATGTITPNANVWQSRFRVESSPYMENSSYTGYSAVAWYLLADPAALPVIEIAALNGEVMPTVESAAADFNVLGIQMRGYSDVGVALQEYRGGVRADGSAAG